MKVSLIEQFGKGKSTAKDLEVIILSILLFIFLLIRLVQAFRLTNLNAWQDQVMFVDPAANLYFGNGFTSSTWFAQTKDKFWAGYPPLYALLLYLWMQLFDFGIHTAHSLNCFLAVACAVILWKSVIRLNIITLARNRLILITLLLLQLAYTSGGDARPDILMACLAVACLLVCSIRIFWLRYTLLVALCSLFPIAGLALPAYSVVLCSLLLIYLRRSFLRDYIFIIVGLLIGSLAIYILYSINGVLDGFINSIINNPTLSGFSQRDKFGGLFGNRILQLLVAVCFSFVTYKVVKGQFSWFSKLSFGVTSIFWIPIGMRLAGAFQFNYSWMLVIPLAICISANLDSFFRISLDRRVSLLVAGSFLILCLVISPYTNFVNLVLNWKYSDYSRIEFFVQENIKENEWVFSDAVTYFAVKKGGRIVIWKPYLDMISSKEKEKVSVLIVRPQDLPLLQGKLGGNWYKHGESLIVSYREQVAELGIYRRK